MESYPTWDVLAAAPEQEIAQKIAWIGLGHQRSKQLKALARTISEESEGKLPCTQEALLKLPGVGRYIADAVLLYVYDKKTFPTDSNVQRLLRRVMGLPVPKGTRHGDPYYDSRVRSVIEKIIQRHSRAELVHMHRGILRIV
jgi:A/G-specific adenine glycosylase